MSSKPTLFENITVFTGDEFIENSYVLVNDGLIVEVGQGTYRTASIPPDAQRISKPGFTLIPGLIDSHVHGLYGNEATIEESLPFGVTTVCDMHNEPRHIEKLRKLAASDKSRYADFKAAGTGATVKGGWPEAVVLSHGASAQAKATVDEWPKLTGPQDADAFVEKQIQEAGASYIKIMHELGDTLRMDLPHPSVETWRAVVYAAHARHLIVVAHSYSYKGAMELLSAGVDGLTHMFLDEPPSDDYVRVFLETGAHCNPTLSGNASHSRQIQELEEQFFAEPLAQRVLSDKEPRQALGLANEKADIEYSYASTRALYKAGVPLIVGSDASGQKRGQAFGLTVHMEIWQMVHKIGMSPAEVLKAGTSLIADRFGFHDRGRIEKGKKADLVLLEGDVREVLRDRNNLCLPVQGVWRDGVAARA